MLSNPLIRKLIFDVFPDICAEMSGGLIDEQCLKDTRSKEENDSSRNSKKLHLWHNFQKIMVQYHNHILLHCKHLYPICVYVLCLDYGYRKNVSYVCSQNHFYRMCIEKHKLKKIIFLSYFLGPSTKNYSFLKIICA